MSEYIERDKITQILQKEAANHYPTPYHVGLLAAARAIESIPAADVLPVTHGKWIEHNYDPEYLSCDFSCSECNVYLEEYYFGEGQWPGKTDHYFCPNCGADMREEI